MISNNFNRLLLLLGLLFTGGCKSSIKEQSDKIYSRHLVKHVDLTIISTRVPDEKSDMNLLLFNNGYELEAIDAKKIIDSLYDKKLIQPLVLVGIKGNEKDDYGMSSLAAGTQQPGTKAAKYNEFVIDELYPFIKKKTVIRKFRSVVICGSSLAGISAFDIAWQNADKIDRVGVFSGNFDYAGTGLKDNKEVNEVFGELLSSRKRPKLEYWIYASENKDSTVFKNSSELIQILQQKNAANSGNIQFVTDKNGNNDIASWRNHFAEFILWAFGK